MTLAKPASTDNLPPSRRAPLPRLWLVTDQHRLADPLDAINRLPMGSGVLFRHHDWPERKHLALTVARLCRRKHLVLLVANDWRLAAEIGADGVHLAEGVARSGQISPCLGWLRQGRILSIAAHSARAMANAQKLGADLCLLSQAFASRSHPGRGFLGPARFALLARNSPVPIIALGGVTSQTWKRLPPGCALGWAAIDGLR